MITIFFQTLSQIAAPHDLRNGQDHLHGNIILECVTHLAKKEIRDGNSRSESYLRRVASYHPFCPRFPLIVSDGSFAQATQGREHCFFHFTEPFLHIASGFEAFSQANLGDSHNNDSMAHCMALHNRTPSQVNTEAWPQVPELPIAPPPFTTSTYCFILLLPFGASSLQEESMYSTKVPLLSFPPCLHLIFGSNHS